MSSAETTPCHPRVQPSLIPVTMLGSAAGRTTRVLIERLVAPRVCAARKRTGGMWEMPSAVAIAMAAVELITITK
jgi:hypothetical protein